ncbi:hypothetical protein EDB83DRAFT_2569193 [Lactarius deliciosus]|nr:hypothetical protein EDB83DRAFT_2569193 [Lactarius deliciosus]
MFLFTDEQTRRFMQVYRDLKSSAPYGHERYYSVLPALTWHISRIMHKIETVRERYHYEADMARPEDMLLFCVLFNSHRTYRDWVESTRPRGHIYLPDFRKSKKSLLVEWTDSNLLATVFAFLALPSPPSSCAEYQRPCANRQHRRRVNADEDASQYLPHGHRAGVTLLACLLAVLLWAVLSFTVAVATFCFVGSANAHTRTLLGTVLGVHLADLVFWDA